jgi:hypothetical protein
MWAMRAKHYGYFKRNLLPIERADGAGRSTFSISARARPGCPTASRSATIVPYCMRSRPSRSRAMPWTMTVEAPSTPLQAVALAARVVIGASQVCIRKGAPVGV